MVKVDKGKAKSKKKSKGMVTSPVRRSPQFPKSVTTPGAFKEVQFSDAALDCSPSGTPTRISGLLASIAIGECMGFQKLPIFLS